MHIIWYHASKLVSTYACKSSLYSSFAVKLTGSCVAHNFFCIFHCQIDHFVCICMILLYTMQVQQFARATFTHRQWHLNYYHSLAESILDVYNLACMYFQLCNLHTRDDIIPIFLDRPGVAGWDARLGFTEGGWRQVLPPAAEALQCFYPKPALWVADPMLHDKVQTSFYQMRHVCCLQSLL